MLKSIALLSIGTLVFAAVAAQADTVKIGTTQYLSTLPGAEAYLPAKRQPRYVEPAYHSAKLTPARPAYVAPVETVTPAETRPEKPYHSSLLAKVRAKENHPTVKTSVSHRHHYVASKSASRTVSRHADSSSESNDLLGKVRAKIRENR